MVFFMITRGEELVNKGQQWYAEQQRQHSITSLKRRAAALCFHLTPIIGQHIKAGFVMFLERSRFGRQSSCAGSDGRRDLTDSIVWALPAQS